MPSIMQYSLKHSSSIKFYRQFEVLLFYFFVVKVWQRIVLAIYQVHLHQYFFCGQNHLGGLIHEVYLYVPNYPVVIHHNINRTALHLRPGFPVFHHSSKHNICLPYLRCQHLMRNKSRSLHSLILFL